MFSNVLKKWAYLTNFLERTKGEKMLNFQLSIATMVAVFLAVAAQSQVKEEKSADPPIQMFFLSGELKGFAKCFTTYWQYKQLRAAIYHDKQKSVSHFVLFDADTGIATRGRISNKQVYISSRGASDLPHEFLDTTIVDTSVSMEEKEKFLVRYSESITSQSESMSVEYIGKSNKEPKFRFSTDDKFANLTEFFSSLKSIPVEKKIAK